MEQVEQGVEFFKIDRHRGPRRPLEVVVDKVGDLKEHGDGARSRTSSITKIIKAGITWLISLLNPAAAFIKACKMIYDVVMFFVEKGHRSRSSSTPSSTRSSRSPAAASGQSPA